MRSKDGNLMGKCHRFNRSFPTSEENTVGSFKSDSLIDKKSFWLSFSPMKIGCNNNMYLLAIKSNTIERKSLIECKPVCYSTIREVNLRP